MFGLIVFVGELNQYFTIKETKIFIQIVLQW